MDCKSYLNEKLYVIGVLSNPVKFAKRYQLFQEWMEYMSKNKKIVLYTIELQQGCRPFVSDATFKLRTPDEIWYKENMMNYVLHRLPEEAKYICWCDTDITFQREDWAEESISQLQTYDIIQPWSTAIDMGPTGDIMATARSFCSVWIEEKKYTTGKYGTYLHPGYVWCATRSILDRIGSFPDFCILGSSDHHMATAFIGIVEKGVNKNVPKSYVNKLIGYQERCNVHLKQNIGFIPGIIHHHFHGSKKRRKYRERWSILIDNKFDPDIDIYTASNGLLRLSGNKIKLRDEIRDYFRQRNEDNLCEEC